MGTRRRYSDKFKREAVQLTTQEDVMIKQIAKDFGILAHRYQSACPKRDRNIAVFGESLPRIRSS